MFHNTQKSVSIKNKANVTFFFPPLILAKLDVSDVGRESTKFNEHRGCLFGSTANFQLDRISLKLVGLSFQLVFSACQMSFAEARVVLSGG